MPTYTIELSDFHSAQEEINANLARYNVLACARRFGKNVYAIRKLLEPALEGKPVAWFSPTYKNLSATWRVLDQTTRQIQKKPGGRNAQEHRLILITDGVVDMWSLDSPKVADSVRGNFYARVVIDEAALLDNLIANWNSIIRPTLTDYRGDAFFLSTPRGENDFYRLWQRGRPDNINYNPRWRSWQMPTSKNPYISPEEIEEARLELLDDLHVYQEEYLAMFVSVPGGLIFDTWSEGNISEDADYIPGGGMVIWGVDDGYVGKIDKSTGFPTGESHPRTILYAQLRKNGQLVVFDEDWALQELEDSHIKRALTKYVEPDYAAVDSSAATLKGHFHANQIQTMNGSHNVEEGIKKLRSGFAPDHNGFRQVMVHPRCKMLRYELTKYAKNHNGLIIKKYDHAIDALRYIYHTLG